MFVKTDFLGTVHGKIGCISCHDGGAGETEMDAAHTGMVRDPDAAAACASCHRDTVEVHQVGLHMTLQGYRTVLGDRGAPLESDEFGTMFENHCASCHASCGQCHVSRPTSSGGGLLSGHTFKPLPPMNTTCTGCHGSRIDAEFKGKNETGEDGARYPADVHYNPGGMPCFECHSQQQVHGQPIDADHRYDGPVFPSCTSEACHPQIIDDDATVQHRIHTESVSCQVCHSVAYKNCYNCHVQLSDEGEPFFKTDPSQMLLRIGHNPIPSEDRPWDYVVVRHVPIDRDSFSFYAQDMLPDFDSRPTWSYATPHNIQRDTPQNASCDSCHDDPDLFLTENKVSPDELVANREVIIEEIPGGPKR